MIKAYTAFTTELDDVRLAVKELTEQIPADALRKNTIGIMACNMEFVQEGITQALQDIFSFPIAGFTANASAVNQNGGYFNLSLTVLTSDTVSFSAGVSAPLTKENAAEELAQLYNDLKEKLPGKPGLLFSFASSVFDVNGDSIVQYIDAVTGGLPNFGTMAIEFTTEVHKPMTVFNGKSYEDSLVLIIFSDEAKVSFNLASIGEDKIRQQNALITAAEGSILKEINNIPVLEYFESIGLAKAGNISGIAAIPFMMDYGDGTKPVVRVAMAKAGSYVIYAGALKVGATLSVVSVDHADVIRTASEIALGNPKGEFMCMFSCLGRALALGLDHMGEISRLIEDCAGRPFLFAYSGGEICPVPTPGGGLVNRFHNDTLISCAFVDG